MPNYAGLWGDTWGADPGADPAVTRSPTGWASGAWGEGPWGMEYKAPQQQKPLPQFNQKHHGQAMDRKPQELNAPPSLAESLRALVARRAMQRMSGRQSMRYPMARTFAAQS